MLTQIKMKKSLAELRKNVKSPLDAEAIKGGVQSACHPEDQQASVNFR